MATLAATAAEPGPSRALQVGLLAKRALRDSRVRTLGFAYLFAFVGYLQPVAYRRTYPTLADRIGFARSFAHNKAVVLFYGEAHNLLTVGGYTAWRVGGTLVIFASVFGLLAAVRALRAEEDGGRTELVLSCAVGRGTAFAGALGAILIATLLLAAGCFAGLLAGGLSLGGSAYLALSVVSVIPVFAGVGAVASQVAPTKRLALELGGAIVALSFLLRVIADTTTGADWVRWLTPMGWAEELRPFTGAHPLVIAAPLLAAVLLLGGAALLARCRDIGSGLLKATDRATPRLGLLSSPTTLAIRSERVGLLIWTASLGGLALVLGVVSHSVSSLGVTKQLEQALSKLGAGPVLTPKAYIGFSFSFVVVVLSALAISQVQSARHEEEDGRVETLMALPVGRASWLAGRISLASVALTGIALATGLLAWAGAASQGVSLSLAQLLGAGLNCLPVALLFLGLSVLAYGALPRLGGAVAYGLVTVAYIWQLIGSLLGVPRWLVNATPFAHVALVPVQSFRAADAAVMLAIGVLAAGCGIWLFARRDLHGA